MTVHSGSANAGHYWSYINTKRGAHEKEDDPNWALTEKDTWLEYEDSWVRDLSFDRIKDDCFGGDSAGSNDGWGFGGTTYGKSAYMLIYERKEKKPIKIVVDKDEPGAIWNE